MTRDELHAEAAELFTLVCDLEAENRELRRALTSAVLWIAERRELLAFAVDLIEQRFPNQEQRAA